KVHHGDLHRLDITRVGVFPATSPSRAIVDCATSLELSQLGRIVDAAMVAGLSTAAKARASARRAGVLPGRRGSVSLMWALRPWELPIVPHTVAASTIR